MHHYTGSGLSNVWLVNGYAQHPTPYGMAVSIDDMDGLHRAIGLEIVHQPPGRMAGEEVRYLRKEMDVSQQALADLLGLKEITVRKWEQQGCPSGPAQILLRAVYLNHVNGDAQLSDVMNRLRRQDQKRGCQTELRFKDDPNFGWQRERMAA